MSGRAGRGRWRLTRRHYNSVKHAQVQRMADGRYSTFHRYARQRLYPADWGRVEPPPKAAMRGNEATGSAWVANSGA